MRKRTYRLFRPVLLLSASAVLLLLSTAGSARAALTYRSADYEMQMGMSNIGVTLLEGGKAVEGEGGLLDGRFEGEGLVPGKHYEEILSVRNSGDIDSYVRVILYRSWKRDGVKDTALSPELIGLGLNTDDWILDAEASSSESGEQFRERLVLYYKKPLAPGTDTAPVTEELWLDSDIYRALEWTGENGVYTSSFLYQNYRLDLEAEVQAVQAFDGEGAIRSAWGVDVRIAEDQSLSLVP